MLVLPNAYGLPNEKNTQTVHGEGVCFWKTKMKSWKTEGYDHSSQDGVSTEHGYD